MEYRPRKRLWATRIAGVVILPHRATLYLDVPGDATRIVYCNPGMLAPYRPQPGDYYLVGEDYAVTIMPGQTFRDTAGF